jgi:hypothetical protein
VLLEGLRMQHWEHALDAASASDAASALDASASDAAFADALEEPTQKEREGRSEMKERTNECEWWSQSMQQARNNNNNNNNNNDSS